MYKVNPPFTQDLHCTQCTHASNNEDIINKNKVCEGVRLKQYSPELLVNQLMESITLVCCIQ